jgi:hypothetical protein
VPEDDVCRAAEIETVVCERADECVVALVGGGAAGRDQAQTATAIAVPMSLAPSWRANIMMTPPSGPHHRPTTMLSVPAAKDPKRRSFVARGPDYLRKDKSPHEHWLAVPRVVIQATDVE